GSGVRGVAQACAIAILATLMGVHLDANPLAWLAALVFVFLGAVCFSTISISIAALVRNRDRVQGLGQIIIMPLFFASNSLYPVAVMPPYVAVISAFNPLSYMVDAMRTLMVSGSPVHFGLPIDLAVLLGVDIVLLLVAGKLYPRVVQ